MKRLLSESFGENEDLFFLAPSLDFMRQTWVEYPAAHSVMFTSPSDAGLLSPLYLCRSIPARPQNL